MLSHDPRLNVFAPHSVTFEGRLSEAWSGLASSPLGTIGGSDFTVAMRGFLYNGVCSDRTVYIIVDWGQMSASRIAVWLSRTAADVRRRGGAH